MAVYGTSPFTAYSSQSFDAAYDKHKSPVASYASSPPVALAQSALTQSTAAAVVHHGAGQRRMLHMLPVVVFMLLACALSAAFLLRPEGQGTGNTYQAHNHLLITRHDALQRQPHQPLRTPRVQPAAQQRCPAWRARCYSAMRRAKHRRQPAHRLECAQHQQAAAGRRQQQRCAWAHRGRNRVWRPQAADGAPEETAAPCAGAVTGARRSSCNGGISQVVRGCKLQPPICAREEDATFVFRGLCQQVLAKEELSQPQWRRRGSSRAAAAEAAAVAAALIMRPATLGPVRQHCCWCVVVGA
ncbi:hypothetical protein COO60DRAFT_54122 [Scenedesmus sp. NREL 46B-D3]|nr:hypothetical protein COO60DRAFT_54122 [Scenedesmus sp. NREL 46B-D3]